MHFRILLLLGICLTETVCVNAQSLPISHASSNIAKLSVEQSHSFVVSARCKNNPSGVFLQAGAHYQFCVADGATWRDARIECTANGWTAADVRPVLRPLVRSTECRRRVPSARWCELIGSVCGDDRELFRIGRGGARWTYTPRRNGTFYAFANDLNSRYHNNSGSLTVTVRRVPAPGQRLKEVDQVAW